MMRFIVRKQTDLLPVFLYRQIFKYEFKTRILQTEKDQCHIRESYKNITEKKGEMNRTSVP